MMALGIMNIAGSFASSYIATGWSINSRYRSIIICQDALNLVADPFSSRFLFSHFSQQHGWLSDSRIKHGAIYSSIVNIGADHTPLPLYPKRNFGSYHYIRCCRTGWFSGSMDHLENWQTGFHRMLGSIPWRSLCVCWDRPPNCSKEHTLSCTYDKDFDNNFHKP